MSCETQPERRRKDDAIATDRKNEAAEKRKRRSPHTARAGAAHDEAVDPSAVHLWIVRPAAEIVERHAVEVGEGDQHGRSWFVFSILVGLIKPFSDTGARGGLLLRDTKRFSKSLKSI